MRGTAWCRAVAVALLVSFAATPTAQAHEGNETQEGYLLVQQALAYLVADTGSDTVELAMEKVDDALEAEDHDGVDLTGLEDGKAALASGDVARARAVLQRSITRALADRPLAAGYDTGTGLVSVALPSRGPLGAGDWAVLVACGAVIALGSWLALRFRPHDSVSGLKLMLGGSAERRGPPVTPPTRTGGPPR